MSLPWALTNLLKSLRIQKGRCLLLCPTGSPSENFGRSNIKKQRYVEM